MYKVERKVERRKGLLCIGSGDGEGTLERVFEK
jgi:hypothetical protein